MIYAVAWSCFAFRPSDTSFTKSLQITARTVLALNEDDTESSAWEMLRPLDIEPIDNQN